MNVNDKAAKACALWLLTGFAVAFALRSFSTDHWEPWTSIGQCFYDWFVLTAGVGDFVVVAALAIIYLSNFFLGHANLVEAVDLAFYVLMTVLTSAMAITAIRLVCVL